MNDDAQRIEVRDDPAAHRYEILVDGARAGSVTYRRSPGHIEFPHTEIDPSRQGQGLGDRLVEAAVSAAVANGESIAPTCPFVSAWFRRHPEYVGHVDDDHRAAVS